MDVDDHIEVPLAFGFSYKKIDKLKVAFFKKVKFILHKIQPRDECQKTQSFSFLLSKRKSKLFLLLT